MFEIEFEMSDSLSNEEYSEDDSEALADIVATWMYKLYLESPDLPE